MTTPDPNLRPAVVADVLAAIDAVLDPPDNPNGAAEAATPVVPVPSGQELMATLERLADYAGQAIAAPALVAGGRAVSDLERASQGADYWQAAARTERQGVTDLTVALLDARRALELVGDAYAVVVVDLERERERADRLHEYANLCADTDRMPTKSRTAAVVREADKAAAARLAARTDSAGSTS